MFAYRPGGGGGGEGAFGQNENAAGESAAPGRPAAASTPACGVGVSAVSFRGTGELAAHRTTRKPLDSPACSAAALGPSGNRDTTRFSLQSPFFGSECRGTTPVLTCTLRILSSSNTRSCTSEAPGRRVSVKVSPAPAPHTGSSVLRRTSVRFSSRSAPLSSRARTNASVSRPASDAARCLPAITHTCTCRISFGCRVRAAPAFEETFLCATRYPAAYARILFAPNLPGASARSAGRVVTAPVSESTSQDMSSAAAMRTVTVPSAAGADAGTTCLFFFPFLRTPTASGGKRRCKSSLSSAHLPPRGTSRAAMTAPPRNSEAEPQSRSNTETTIPRNVSGSARSSSPHRTRNRSSLGFHVGFRVILATLVLYLCFLSAPNAPTSTNGSA